MPTVTTIRSGAVRADVSLVKASGELKAAKWETRRVGVDGQPLATLDTAEQQARHAAVDAIGGYEPDAAADDPMGLLEPASTPAVDRVGAAPPHDATHPPVIPQTPDQALQRDNLAARLAPAATSQVQRGVTVDGTFVDLTAELESIDERAQIEGMEIVGAIKSSVPRARIRDAYWIEPRDSVSGGVLRLLHGGLAARSAGFAVRWTKRKNQAVGVIVPDGVRGALLLLELEFAAAMREPSKRARVAGELSEREQGAVGAFIDSLWAKRSDLDAVVDERRQMQAELLEAARNGEAWQPPELDEFDAEVAEILAQAARERSVLSGRL